MLAGASLVRCAAHGGRQPVLVDPEILPKVSARDATWGATRTAISFTQGKASNCASYERLKPTGILEDVSNQLVKSEYLICDVVGNLGQDVDLKPLAGAGYGAALASRFDATDLKPGDHGVAVMSETWSYNLELEATGGNYRGYETLLVEDVPTVRPLRARPL
jgi:hypothetical protein